MLSTFAQTRSGPLNPECLTRAGGIRGPIKCHDHRRFHSLSLVSPHASLSAARVSSKPSFGATGAPTRPPCSWQHTAGWDPCPPVSAPVSCAPLSTRTASPRRPPPKSSPGRPLRPSAAALQIGSDRPSALLPASASFTWRPAGMMAASTAPLLKPASTALLPQRQSMRVIRAM